MSDERLSPLLNYFDERVMRVFDCQLCRLMFEGDEDMRDSPAENPRAWVLRGIHDACLDSTLMALRDLDDFFTPGRGRPDDLKASVFGFEKNCKFLTASERESIDKLVAHSTLRGAQKQPGWDILELVSKGVSQSQNFLDWIIATYPHSYLCLVAVGTKKTLESRLKYITAEVQKRRIAKAVFH